MDASSQRPRLRYAGVGAGILLCVLGALLFFVVPFDANVHDPTVHDKACGTPVGMWTRADARVTLRKVASLPPPQGAASPAEQRAQLARVDRVVEAAKRYVPCREAMRPRTIAAGVLVFLGAVTVVLFLGLRRDPVTSQWKLGFAASLALIAVFAAGMRVSFSFYSAQYRILGFDADYYNRGWHTIGGSFPSALFPPAFTTYIAAVSAVGIHARLWHIVFSGLLGVSLVVMTALLGRRIGGERVGLTAGLIASAYPVFINADGAIMADSLYAAFVAATLFVAFKARERASTRTWIVLGVLVGLATLTRGEGLLLIPFLLVPLALSIKGEILKRRLMALGTACLVVVVLLLPWTIRNLVVMHHFIWVSNNSATVIAGANCDETYSGLSKGFWRVECLQRGYTPDWSAQVTNRVFNRAGPKYDETYQNNRSRAAAVRYARSHTSRFPAVVTARVLRTWGFYAPFRQMKIEAATETRTEEWQYVGWYVYLAMLPFAVYGAIARRRERKPIWPFLSVIAMVTFTSAVTYGNQRFRIAAEPAIIVLAAVGVTTFAAQLRRRRRSGPADPVDVEPVHAVTGS